MRAELAAIKRGDRVVYAAGGVEHQALALDAASEGWSQGIRLGTIALSLIYLDDLGVPVKVIAAPLLGVAADDEHLAEVAQAAAEKTFGYLRADERERAEMVAEQMANIKAHPRTIGWRPDVENEEVATLRAQLAQASEAIGQLNHALAQTMKAPDPAPPQPSAEDLDAVATEAQAARATAGSVAGAPIDNPEPAGDKPILQPKTAETQSE